MSYECAALYARLSPRPDGSYDGVDEQERLGRAYAAATWPGMPVEVFADRGISAANGDHRPELERLRAWVRNGQVTRVWSVEQSRLERREGPWFELAAELEAAGITEVHTHRDGIIALNDVVGGIRAVLSAHEVRRIRSRVNDQLDARAAAGVPAGTCPFGYRAVGRREERTYEIVPEQAEAIRWAAKKVLDGWSLSRIAAELDGQGLRGAHGGKIGPVGVHGWLTAPSTAGLRVHRGEITGPGNWAAIAILDEQTWREVGAVLAQPRVVRRKDGGTYPVTAAHTGRPVTGPAGRKYLLTGGLARCDVCGAALIGAAKQLRNTKRVRTVPYLLCHPSRGGRSCTGIALEPVEALVVAELFTELDRRPSFAAALSADQHAGTRAELAASLAAVHAERAEYARDAAAGTMTRSEWLAMRPVFDEREARLRADLAVVPAPAGRADWREVRELWADLPLDEQRAVLRQYIAKVVIRRARPGTQSFDPGRVSIKWVEV